MTKLEPTRTNSDLTATERLRALLDERGAGNYTHEAPAAVCLAFFDGNRWHDCWESVGGEVNVTFSMTPEQAIAATLGAGTLTAKQVVAIAGRHQPDYCSDTHVCFDWQAIADELNSTLGSSDCTNNCTNNCTNSERTETCHADETDTWECVCDQIGRYGKRVTIHVMECSECGRTYEHVNGDYEFCPHCGRKVVDPTTNDVDAEVDA